ncbi:hypothetical protein EYZ11_004231 [Aspergillus tanneri]|uniref:Peptidase S59 domain-containing protein n=1 Tax=Aspergillus tanneri TaxID=1220188 RepID=A0A4S3JRX3_9EURO|nr:hypothetical protein EYZ11_004231 [Aspergillus tanneri]
MSFGFGGFGQNNQQSSGFGAGSSFGGTNTGGGGFGSTTSPFGGGNTSGGSMFGNTSNSFGSGGGFGSGTQNQSNTLFGSQNRTGGFGTGTSSSGSLFGGGTSTAGASGFGSGTAGFGSTGNTGGFGSSGTTGGGIFGNKTGGFGSTTGTSTGTSTGGFGTSGGFGSGTGFGGGSGTAFQQAVPPSDGTGSTPFSAFTEKDGASNMTNHYQSIPFMQPYSKYSFEELRLGDYSQGRRFGNGSGQAGAFGTSAFGGSGFGAQQSTGFGSTSTPFGGGTSAPSAFGQTQTTGGFGSSASANPLFGATKPATSLFGGGTTTGTSQPAPFGSTASTSGGFGSAPGTGGAFGSGATASLFGNNQQQQQSKPLFGGGSTTSTGTGFGGFGQQQNTSTSSPFGGTSATSTPFGQQQQQTGTGAFGGFGQQNQAQNQNQTQNKGLFGGFGQNTQQQQSTTPSLFGGGGTSTGTSLFGQNNQQAQQQPAAPLFGGASNQQASTGSLFGGGAQQQGQKSLFGTGTTGTGANASPFGGFGANQNQQTGTSSLFGGAQNQQQQKPGSLFGGTTGTGSSLFGGQNTATQNAGSSLFGNTQAQQQPSGGLGLGTSSLFGNTQQAQAQQPQQPQQPAPGSLQASLLEGNPYGNQSIFSGLPAPSAPSPGPLATPLSASVKQKQRTPLPVYKNSPHASTRLITPPKRQGYGFSYSTYGTPSSSNSTPNGLGGSLLGGSLRGSVNGSLGRSSFSKSFSTSNLRKTFDPDTDSVLSPGALSSGPPRLSGGSLKRLTIDRSLRNDIFSRPASTLAAPITAGEEATQSADKVKKKVSFDSTTDAASGGEVVPVESQTPEPTSEELGFLRSIRKSGTINGINGVKSIAEDVTRPEMESVRGKELPAVPENAEQDAITVADSRLPFTPGFDPQPGQYWMQPTRAEINKMSRDQQKHVVGFTVGRQRCGQVTFDEPVDLTSIDLDQIFGGLVEIGVRKITVYPDEAIKPPMGRDKKSPSPLTSGPLFDKHVDRLRKVHNTEFIDYETRTGTWVFKVPHYTTYGLDYDSDDEGESLNQSTLSAAPDTPTPKAQSPANLDNTVGSEQMSTFSTDESFVGSMAGVDDDTFDFKKRKMVPGAFGNQPMEADERSGSGDDESFLGEGSTGSTTEQDGDDITESQNSGESEVGLDEDEEMDMAGTFPILHPTVEQDNTKYTDQFNKDTRSPMKTWNTPPKAGLDLSGDWAEQLQRTISPRKQNRDALREIQRNAFSDRASQENSPKDAAAESRPKGFSTSIDLMNSLFQQPRKQPSPPLAKGPNAKSKGFEWPYIKTAKTFAGETNELNEDDLAFHHSFKPRWGPVGSIICVQNGLGDTGSDERWQRKLSVTSEERDIVLLAFNRNPDCNEMLDAQREQSVIDRVDGIPFARLAKADFQQLAQAPSTSGGSDQERLMWQLSNILFNDDIEDDISAGVPSQLRCKFLHRIKKDRLSRLWQEVIREKHAHTLGKANSAEERAVRLLCSHRIDEACNVLMASQNFHLATLLAQIGRDPTSRADMSKQVEMWRQHNVFSEMSEPIRALYELLAGNALRSEGRSGGALEDRTSTFTFTERFGLDWYQAFGLRLWYGITDDEPIEAAVSKFYEDLSSGKEPAFPCPPHQGNASGLETPTDTLGRESPLWVLLKLYSSTVGRTNVPLPDLPAALLPESVAGDKLSSRLTFQLYQLLAGAVGNHGGFQTNAAQADQLVRDYAWELSCSGDFERVLFVLLHLSRPSDRERAVKETLARFACRLPDPVTPEGTVDATWQYLTKDLQLPEGWIWVAKALYARDVGDAAREVDCLVRGKNWNDAHATFCRVVGPTAVIEHDYVTLERLVSGFGEAPDRKVRGWVGGGGIYEDYLHLATARSGKRDASRLNRLINALATMREKISQASSVEGLEERVAFKEMSRAVASWAAREDGKTVEMSNVLGLPLTGDARLLQMAEMSRRYYSVIMAGAY